MLWRCSEVRVQLALLFRRVLFFTVLSFFSLFVAYLDISEFLFIIGVCLKAVGIFKPTDTLKLKKQVLEEF